MVVIIEWIGLEGPYGHHWLVHREQLLQHRLARPSLSPIGLELSSFSSARWFSSPGTKDLNLQRSEQSNLQTSQFGKVSYDWY